jgi:catechol 2,3-dioxygenase-like lactoylglutathione lyase family enzyme
MIAGIDHVVILVKDLEKATTDFGALGFTVVPGGEHTDGATHNALIAFADGTYLELIAFKRSAPEHRWWPYTQAGTGEGLIDYALLPSNIAEDIAASRERGLNLEGPFPGGRKRLDGQEIRWQTGLPPSHDLPFFCADVTPRELRVPSGAAWEHPNGVSGIATLTIAVADLAASVAHYEALLGTKANPTPTSDLEVAVFPCGKANIIVAKAGLPDHNHEEHLAARQEGPIALNLYARASTGSFDPHLTHSVALAVSPDPAEARWT